MPYTVTARKTTTVPTNTFGGMKGDSNHVAMPFGNIINTQDATGTPLQSPLTVNTTATLVVPAGAVQCTIISTTNAVQVSEDSTQTAYFTLPAATLLTIDCVDMANIYLKTGSSTVVNFMFKVVQYMSELETLEIDGKSYPVIGHDPDDGLPILRGVATSKQDGFDEEGNPKISVNINVPAVILAITPGEVE